MTSSTQLRAACSSQSRRHVIAAHVGIVLLLVSSGAWASSVDAAPDAPAAAPSTSTEAAPAASPPRPRSVSFLPPPWLLRGSYVFHPTLSDQKLAHDLQQETRAALRIPVPLSPNVVLFAGANYGMYHLGGAADGSDTFVHNITLPLSGIWATDDFMLYVEGSAGVYSDFAGFELQDVQLLFQGLYGWVVNDELMLEVGALTYPAFGDFAALPVLGLVWKPTRLFELNILLPSYAAMFLYPTDSIRLRLGLDIDPGRSRLRGTFEGEKGAFNASLLYLRAGAMVDYAVIPGVNLQLSGGLATEGLVLVTLANGERAPFQIVPAGFVTAGIEVNADLIRRRR